MFVISCNVFYRSSLDAFNKVRCDGYINFPLLDPNDEANCSQQCLKDSRTTPCDCNKPQNMTCKTKGFTCYKKGGKIVR